MGFFQTNWLYASVSFQGIHAIGLSTGSYIPFPSASWMCTCWSKWILCQNAVSELPSCFGKKFNLIVHAGEYFNFWSCWATVNYSLKKKVFYESHSGRGCVRPKRHWDDGFHCGANPQSYQLFGAVHVVDHGGCARGRRSCVVPHSHSVGIGRSNRILHWEKPEKSLLICISRVRKSNPSLYVH